jgi:hypothetical protein
MGDAFIPINTRKIPKYENSPNSSKISNYLQ